ncbi:methyltransferase [Arthrobacter sp. TMN-49]
MESIPFLDTASVTGFAGVVAALRAAGCVYAEDEAAILLEAAGHDAALGRMLAHRISGVPLEHLVGWAQFHGLRIAVAPGIFVPRLRTEFLVEKALEVLGTQGAQGAQGTQGTQGARRRVQGSVDSCGNKSPVVVDLCCGSGAVGAALGHENSGFELHAADIDPVAVAYAAGNLRSVNGHAYCGDLFAALPEKLRGTVAVIVANAPYVPTDDIAFMPSEARLHEPLTALNGGSDGLDIQRRIAARAHSWLRPGGSLLVETSARQAELSADIMAAHGFAVDISHSEELAGTVVTGRRASLSGGVY